MERKQETWRIIYRFTTSHEPEGQYCVVYVWANDRDDARRVFLSKFNNRNADGTWSSIGYEILQVDGGKLGEPVKIEDVISL